MSELNIKIIGFVVRELDKLSNFIMSLRHKLNKKMMYLVYPDKEMANCEVIPFKVTTDTHLGYDPSSGYSVPYSGTYKVTYCGEVLTVVVNDGENFQEAFNRAKKSKE